MARSGVYRRAFVSLDTTEDGKRPNQKGLAFMANIKSQKKRIITNEKRRMRNRAVKSELKTAVRHVKDAVAEGNGKDAYAFACEACRLMDKAASKGVIHKNQAANRKSGIMRLANTVVTAEDIAAYEKPVPKPQKTGSKKAEAKAARKAAMAAASEEKAKRREKTPPSARPRRPRRPPRPRLRPLPPRLRRLRPRKPPSSLRAPLTSRSEAPSRLGRRFLFARNHRADRSRRGRPWSALLKREHPT